MTKTRSTKRALILSALSLLVCVSMLVGSTFAWFTDSVVSGNNIIQSGNLDVEMYWADGTEDPATTTWTDASTGAIFNYDLWEPGYTEARHIKIANEGSLALKYTVNIMANGEVSDLADVIDVYFLDPAAQIADRTALNDSYKVGTLSDVLNGTAGTTNGSLLAKESVSITIALKMQESAGNEYQNLSIGSDFSVQVLATQYTYEEDSFGNDYDANAAWYGDVDTSWYNDTDSEFTLISGDQLAGLAALVNEGTDFTGKTVKLGRNIDLNNTAWTPIGDTNADVFVGFKGTFDGQGNTISNLFVSAEAWGVGLFGYMDASTNATIKNVNIHNANVVATDCCGIIVGYATYGTFSNIHVTGNVNVTGTSPDGHVGGIAGCGYNASFDNCSVIAAANSSITSGGSFVGGIVGYQCNYNKAFTGCEVEGLAITGKAAVGGITGIMHAGGTLTGCTVNNVVLTKTSVGGNPSIGALTGNYTGSAATNLTNNTVSDVTLNGSAVPYSVYNVLYGSNYSGEATALTFDTTGTTTANIVNNLSLYVANNADLSAAINAGEKNIQLGAGTYSLPTLSGKDGVTIIGTEGTVIGGDSASTGFGGNFGKNTTIKNVTFTGKTNGVRSSYAQGGTTVFENCTFAGDSTYGFHVDESKGATFIFNNCTFSGFNAFAGDLAKVTFNNCTFLHNGNYGHTNIWSVGEFNNCTFGEGATYGVRGDGVIYVDGVQQ